MIAGYCDEETGFGMNIDGNPAQLMELYEQTKDPEERKEIIDSYYKFETLPGKQKTYFKQACARESNSACMGASRPEGQLESNLMRQFAYFGLDYRGAWKLLMDDGRWKEWKRQNGFAGQQP